jgi:transcription initiation factor IIE alpha subunit
MNNKEEINCKKYNVEHNLYICPMHPEVQQNSPGTCPKCGMALELMQIQHSDKDMSRTFIEHNDSLTNKGDKS